MYFSMARSYDVTVNRRLQRVLEVAEKDWKKKNREVNRIDKVLAFSYTLQYSFSRENVEKKLNGSRFNCSKCVEKLLAKKL